MNTINNNNKQASTTLILLVGMSDLYIFKILGAVKFVLLYFEVGDIRKPFIN